MGEFLVHRAEAEDHVEWVTQHEDDEAGDRNDKVPHVALDQHYEEAGVQESVQTGDLAHDQLHYMPSVEAQNVFHRNSPFNNFDGCHFVDGCDESLCPVKIVDPVVDTSSTLSLDKEAWQQEHHREVSKGEDVHRNANGFHRFRLHVHQLVCVKLESECFVLRVNESFPDPDREDDPMPAFNFHLVLIFGK